AAGTRYSADELVRMREDVTALLTLGMKTAASRTLELMQPPAPDDLHTLAESLRQDLLQAHAIFATRGSQAVRELTRVGCNALRLYRACHRTRCRKARTCRGDAAACLNHANVPEPAREWARRLMVAELAPWLPFASLAAAPPANESASAPARSMVVFMRASLPPAWM